MKERPILFSGEMVRAILDGRKTQTRRVVKPPKGMSERYAGVDFPCPYGVRGDRLWVREAFSRCACGLCLRGWPKNGYHMPSYRADTERDIVYHPSIHMPRWASRIDLEITGIRVERVQDISEHDVLCEGVRWDGEHDSPWMLQLNTFHQLWDSINGKRGYGWDKNPWVWVVEFKRIRP